MENKEMNEWICAIRPANTWIFDDKKDRYFRPWIMILLHTSSGMIMDFHMFDQKPFPHEVFNQILASSKKSINKNTVIKNPEVISFGDQQFVAEIKGMLTMYGIGAAYKKQDALIDPIIEEFAKKANADFKSIPGLLSVPKVTRKMVECLFEQAKYFYQSKPWEIIDDTYLLEVLISQQDKPYYVGVLGAGGIEKGLAVFTSWEKYEYFSQHTDDADWVPNGYHLFSFDFGPDVSFEDMDNAEKFKWPLPEQGIYPSPIYFSKSEIRRPNFEMILWYQAALRAIPQYLDQFKDFSGQIRLRGGELHEFRVETSGGTQDVRINFYLGEMSKIPTTVLESEPIGDEPIPFIDRRGLEGDLNELFLDYFGEEQQEWTPVRKAQELMYDAWETPQWQERIALAKKALKISPDCADAYVLLAEEEADTLEESLRLYREGVAAGKRALGEEFFNDLENIGHFWGILDTRPFMRALYGYAVSLVKDGKDDLALDCFHELLRLNPNDNQGVRYSLLEFLIRRMRIAEAKELIEVYNNDDNVEFAYSQLLLAFEGRVSEKVLLELLERAIKENAFVPDFLTEKKPIPDFDSYYIAVGGKAEAAYYAVRYLDCWKAFQGALDWLKKNAP